MRTILLSAVLIGTLATGTAIETAQAKGCIKGALVGGCLYRKLCMDGARGAREKLTFSEAFGCGHVFGL